MNNNFHLPSMYEDPVHSLQKLAEITKQLSVKRRRLSRQRISLQREHSEESINYHSEVEHGEIQILEQTEEDPVPYVQEAKIVGVHKKERPKRSYLFVILVKWTDGSHVIVYRRLSELTTFQGALLNMTKNEKLTEETKYLKKLTKHVRKTSQVVNGSMQRLRMIDSINRYLDAVTYFKKVAQSETLTEFLRPSKIDLNSSLWSGQGRTYFYIARDILGHRNPMMNEDNPDADMSHHVSQMLSRLPSQETTSDSSGSFEKDDTNISWPLQSEIFVALCDMVPSKDDAKQNIIGLRKGELVEVLNQHDSGWWLVKRTEDDENHNNTEMECGYVPATYLAPKGFHVDHADSQGSIDDIELDWDNDEYPPNEDEHRSSDEDASIENKMAPTKRHLTRQNAYDSVGQCPSSSSETETNWFLRNNDSENGDLNTNFIAEITETKDVKTPNEGKSNSPTDATLSAVISGDPKPLLRRKSADGILSLSRSIATKKSMLGQRSTFEFYPKSRPLFNSQATARSLSVLTRKSMGSRGASSSSGSSSSSSGNGKIRLEYITNKKYKGERPDELSFEANAIISVQKKNSSGWWLARYQGKEGLVPAVYLTKYNDPLRSLGIQVLGLL